MVEWRRRYHADTIRHTDRMTDRVILIYPPVLILGGGGVYKKN